jgi:hypothetical protein
MISLLGLLRLPGFQNYVKYPEAAVDPGRQNDSTTGNADEVVPPARTKHPPGLDFNE